jgi:hypothetical protein
MAEEDKVKEKLLDMLRDIPASAVLSEEFLDDLAEDIMALIIRAITPFANDCVEDVEHQVVSIYNSSFGVQLHNMFWTHPPGEAEGLPTEEFERISKAMIQTMLLELPGETIKRRLQELKEPSKLVN